MKHDAPPLQTHHARMKWCIRTILKHVGIGGRRYDLSVAEMQRGPDWARQMEICADKKKKAGEE